MKTYQITIRVQIQDEETLIQVARDQFERDNGEGTGEEEIETVGQALVELVHLGAWQPNEFLTPDTCGVEIEDLHAKEMAP